VSSAAHRLLIERVAADAWPALEEVGNVEARSLYASAGFGFAHSYHYRSLDLQH